MKSIQIAPSILSANFACLGQEVQKVTEAGADILHIDVMDGHFVPNITIGPCVVESLRAVTLLPLDVHLMIADPEKYLDPFVKSGSDWITFHVEAVKNPHALLDKIHALGKKAGLSLRPATPIQTLAPFLRKLDLVLIMSVEPGFGGQSFQAQSLDKVLWLRQQSVCPIISIDGGINLQNAPLAIEAGVDILVAGSAIFKADNPADAVKKLRETGKKE